MFNPLSILLHVVNAAILLVALYFLLVKPVRKYMNQRSEGVAKELQSVEDEKAALRKAKEQSQLELKAAQKQAGETIARSVAQAQEQAQHVLEEAHADADLVLQRARAEADATRKNAQNEMQDSVVSLGVALAGKLLQREVKQEDHAKLVDDFLKKVE